jgi:hypothetical protein
MFEWIFGTETREEMLIRVTILGGCELDLTLTECCPLEGSSVNGLVSFTRFLDGLCSKPLVVLGRPIRIAD